MSFQRVNTLNGYGLPRSTNFFSDKGVYHLFDEFIPTVELEHVPTVELEHVPEYIVPTVELEPFFRDITDFLDFHYLFNQLSFPSGRVSRLCQKTVTMAIADLETKFSHNEVDNHFSIPCKYDEESHVYTNFVKFNLHSYVDRHLQYLRHVIDWPTIFTALTYVYSLDKYLSQKTLPLIIHFAILAATKYVQDDLPGNDYFRKISCACDDMKTYNKLEREFYDMMDWNLNVNARLYNKIVHIGEKVLR